MAVNENVIGGAGEQKVPITGGSGGSPTGAAGGDLGGSYPNPTLASAALSALKALTPAADKIGYFDGVATAALASFTSIGRSAVGSASAQALRAVAGTVWANLANVVTDFGADATGAADSTSAFVNAAAAVAAGTYNGVFMPSGVFKVTPGMVVFPAKVGFVLIGNGSPGDTNTAVTRGTYIKSDGSSTEPLITFHGGASVYCANFTIWGNSSASLTGACIGIRWENVSGAGIGSGVSVFDMVRMLWCDYFWDNGHTGTGLDTNNCADFMFRRCDWSHANNGMVVRQDQNVNFQFDGGGMISVSGTAFNFIKGGNLTARNFFTSEVGTLLVPGDGGNNVYWHFFDCHFDSGTFLTLFDGSGGSGGYVYAEFHNCVCNTLQLTSGGTRCKVAANQTVVIRGGRELCGTNAKLFTQTGGVVLVENAHLPTDATKVRDTGSSGGKYRVQNCVDHTTGTFIAAYGDMDTVPQTRGGTGIDTSGATDGQVLIGKTSDHSLNLATMTAGSGISITNGGGSITIAASAWTELVAAADQKITNATNQDSTYLQFAVVAGGSYSIEASLPFTNNDGNGISFRFAVASGTMTGKGNVLTTSTAGAASHATIGATAAANTGSISVGSASDDTIPYATKVTYSFKASASTTFKLQFGNVTATAGRNSSVLKNATMRYIRHD